MEIKYERKRDSQDNVGILMAVVISASVPFYWLLAYLTVNVKRQHREI